MSTYYRDEPLYHINDIEYKSQLEQLYKARDSADLSLYKNNEFETVRLLDNSTTVDIDLLKDSKWKKMAQRHLIYNGPADHKLLKDNGIVQ